MCYCQDVWQDYFWLVFKVLRGSWLHLGGFHTFCLVLCFFMCIGLVFTIHPGFWLILLAFMVINGLSRFLAAGLFLEKAGSKI